MGALENTDRSCNILKNVVALVAISLGIWLYLPFFGLLRKELAAKKDQVVLEQFNILFATFKVSEVKLTIADKLNTPARLQGKQDIVVSSTAKEAAELLQAAPEPMQQQTAAQVLSWVYLGDLRKDGWHVENFELNGDPQEGQATTAINDVFKRAGKPVNIGGDDWKLGEIQGIVNKGVKVTLKSLYSIEGNGGGRLWWAQIAS